MEWLTGLDPVTLWTYFAPGMSYGVLEPDAVYPTFAADFAAIFGLPDTSSLLAVYADGATAHAATPGELPQPPS